MEGRSVPRRQETYLVHRRSWGGALRSSQNTQGSCKVGISKRKSRGAGGGEPPAGARGVLASTPFPAAAGGTKGLCNSPAKTGPEEYSLRRLETATPGSSIYNERT